MTKQEVITEVIKSEKFRLSAQKATNNSDLLDDLLQDICLLILEMPDEKFEAIKNPVTYCFAMVWKNYNSVTSPFYKKYRQKGVIVPAGTNGLKDVPDDSYDVVDDVRLNMIMEELASYGWYDEKLLLSYYREGSMLQLHKKTGIHRRTLRHTIKDIKDRLKTTLNPNE